MNYLAHAFLSPNDPYVMTGNLITDMLKGHLRKEVDPLFDNGINLHRHIDNFTDRHPIVSEFKHQLYSRFHKYAPVVSDIFMDYLLVKNWEKYNQINLESFISRTYEHLNKVKHLLPEEIQPRLESMITHNWLMAYTTIESINNVFERMKNKLSDKEMLKNGGGWLEDNFEKANEMFLSFFPDLIAKVADYK